MNQNKYKQQRENTGTTSLSDAEHGGCRASREYRRRRSQTEIADGEQSDRPGRFQFCFLFFSTSQNQLNFYSSMQIETSQAELDHLLNNDSDLQVTTFGLIVQRVFILGIAMEPCSTEKSYRVKNWPLQID